MVGNQQQKPVTLGSMAGDTGLAGLLTSPGMASQAQGVSLYQVWKKKNVYAVYHGISYLVKRKLYEAFFYVLIVNLKVILD